MQTLNQIKSKLKSNKVSLMTKYPIAAIAIFGSYARNEQKLESDLDLMVEFNVKIGIQFIDLADEIESLIGLKTDVVSKNGIKPQYYNQIKSDLIYI